LRVAANRLGAARVHGAAGPFAHPRAVVGARAVGAIAPGEGAAVGAACRLLPLELGGQALAGAAAIANRIVKRDAGLRKAGIGLIGIGGGRGAGAGRHAAAIGGSCDLGPVDEERGGGCLTARPLGGVAVVRSVKEGTGRHRHHGGCGKDHHCDQAPCHWGAMVAWTTAGRHLTESGRPAARKLAESHARTNGTARAVCLAVPARIEPVIMPTVERLLYEGAVGLSEVELIAIVMGTGLAPAAALLDQFGALAGLESAGIRHMVDVTGTLDGGCRLRGALVLGGRRLAARPPPGMLISSADDVYRACAPRLLEEKREVFVALALDCRNRLQGETVIATGQLTSVEVDPREAFRVL